MPDRRTTHRTTRFPRTPGPIVFLALAATACAAPAPPAPAAPSAAAAPVAPAARLRGADIADGIPPEWGIPVVTQPAVAEHGMVTSDAPLATEAGVAILRAGGNAIDAAVATAFALAVVYPEAGNLGGGGFMVARLADGGTAALDFREKAPLAATRDMYLDAAGEVTEASTVGYRASGVPGSVAGLWAAHKRYGALPWADVVAPAIGLAEDGFIVNERLAASLAAESEKLRAFPGSVKLYFRDGETLKAGTLWRNPELAAVLRRIADEGPAGFYRGRTAELIVAEMQRGGGLISAEDLAAYEPAWREPVRFDYRGYHVVSMPPASSGGITLALMANIVEGYDLRSMGWHSPEALHVMTEAMRRAFADRNHYLGDPDFVDIPRARLLSKAYAASRRESIDLHHATRSMDVAPGIGAGDAEGTETTHFSVVDGQGNAVAITTTLNFLFGSGVTVDGAGLVLNDEMDDFAAKPGTPNGFGLVQGEANAIAPGKRMLSAMTPTVVLSPDGQPFVITGARGGPRIISAVFQILSNVVDYGMDIAAAVSAPRIHHQHLPDVLYYEAGGLPGETIQALEAMGHHVQARNAYIGNAPSILRRPGRWTGVADPRVGGLAAGQ